FEVAFANRHVQWRRVIVLACAQGRAALNEPHHAREIAIPTCGQLVPHVCRRSDDAIVKLHRKRLLHFKKGKHGMLVLRRATTDYTDYTDEVLAVVPSVLSV